MKTPEEIEEDYHSKGKREARKERKRLSAADRSKYKKTDQEKGAGEVEEVLDLPLGRVLSITAQGMHVEYQGSQYVCTLKGSLLKERGRAKNLVTVGDWVYFQIAPDNEGVIVSVKPRYSFLSRADSLARRHEKLIAANIDYVIITVSVVAPRLKPALVDRYLIAATLGNMTPIIVVNKIDLLSTDPYEEIRFEELRRVYTSLGFTVLPISAETGYGLEALTNLMKDKASVFSGQSGVGKSSLINGITGTMLATKQVTEKTGKGSHTTTTAQLLPLPAGGWCIDTPGIRSFGLWELEPSDIQSHFSEVAEVGKECRFPNCSHTHEPDCAVLKAVEAEEISSLRFESYCSLLESGEEDHKRR